MNDMFYFSNEILHSLPGMGQTAGETTDPTLTELMKTMYDGAAPRQLMYVIFSFYFFQLYLYNQGIF